MSSWRHHIWFYGVLLTFQDFCPLNKRETNIFRFILMKRHKKQQNFLLWNKTSLLKTKLSLMKKIFYETKLSFKNNFLFENKTFLKAKLYFWKQNCFFFKILLWLEKAVEMLLVLYRDWIFFTGTFMLCRCGYKVEIWTVVVRDVCWTGCFGLRIIDST